MSTSLHILEVVGLCPRPRLDLLWCPPPCFTGCRATGLSQTSTGISKSSSARLGGTVTWVLSPEVKPEAPGTEVTEGCNRCQGFSPRAAGLLTQSLSFFSREPFGRAGQDQRIVLSGYFHRGAEALAMTHTSGECQSKLP